MAKQKISIIKCQTYDNNLKKKITELLKPLGGMKKFVKKGNRVLLKPNMLGPGKSETVRTTHPQFIIAIAKLVKEAGGKVVIGDSPGIASGEKVSKSNGLFELCQQNNFELVEFDKKEDVKHPNGKLVKVFPLSEEIKKADVIINIPKIKTHGLTSMTCCVKNLFGCVSGIKKGQYHVKFPERYNFSKMLLDLMDCVNSNLTIVDGIWGMEGKGGPIHGNKVELNVMLAGTDCVALDTIICDMLNIDPMKIPTNSIARMENYGETDLKKIEVIGTKPKFKNKYDFHEIKGDASFALIPMPKFVVRWINNRLTARPIIQETCVGCADCEKICPAQAITMKPKKNVKGKISTIDRTKCIKCYCCHEICRYKAIKLKKPLMGKLFGL